VPTSIKNRRRIGFNPPQSMMMIQLIQVSKILLEMNCELNKNAVVLQYLQTGDKSGILFCVLFVFVYYNGK
jgi:hypothetical protein